MSRITGRRRRFAAAFVTFMVALMVSALTPGIVQANAVQTDSATPTGLTLSGTPQIGRIADRTHVVGTGWSPNAPIQVSTCGNNALNGSPDCTTGDSTTDSTDAKGNFQFDMTFGRPPKPCPCVLHAFSPVTQTVVNFSIELIGFPTATPVKDSSARLLTAAASVSGVGPIQSLLGFPAGRSLDLVITNTGTLPILNPPTYVYLGKGQDPTTLIGQPAIGSITPGATVAVSIPFELPAFSFGSYTVRVDIPGMDAPTNATATTSTYPWLLLVLAWLAIQIPLLGLNRRRGDDEYDQHLIELDDPFGGLALAGTGTGAAVAALSKSGSNGAMSPVGAASLSSIPPWALSKMTGLNPVNPTPTLTPTVTMLPIGAAATAGAFGVARIRQFVEAPPTNGHPVSSRVVIGGVASSATAVVATPASAQSSHSATNPYAPPAPTVLPPPSTAPVSNDPPPPSTPPVPPPSAPPRTEFDPLDSSVPLSTVIAAGNR